MVSIIIISIAIITFVLLIVCTWIYEKKSWNTGKCKNCGSNLIFVIKDSQGGRMYQCPKCGKSVWITWLSDN